MQKWFLVLQPSLLFSIAFYFRKSRNVIKIVFKYYHLRVFCHACHVYPEAKHCACILHLKRNIRTYFKDKHLGYLVGKAARGYKLCQFYRTFNEIKTINPSCADYLIGIGFEH